MSSDQWTAVDRYFDRLFTPPDSVLDTAMKTIEGAGLPAISVTPQQGKLLNLLARAHNARTILEIGTLGGYSTIWLARALPADGKLITLEIDPQHAEVARQNFARAGLNGRIDLRLGSAHDTLPTLVDDPAAPFDLVFIDADKVSTIAYLQWALKLTHPGSLIFLDNVVRNGGVADPNSSDANVQGVQRGLEWLASEPRVTVTAIQTVGEKSYDGFALALVTA